MVISDAGKEKSPVDSPGLLVDSTTVPLSADQIDWLKSTIRDIPDFPRTGIVFKDLTTLLRDGVAFGFVVSVMAKRCARMNPDYIAGIEARGFILGPAIADRLGVGFVPIRKPGKLPHTTEKVDYQLEYGTDSLEVHVDAVEPGRKVVVVDDLLATGGTARAAYELITRLGAEVVSLGFMVELAFLSGRSKQPDGVDVFSLVVYD